MKVGVPKETVEGERRVALVPEGVEKLGKQDIEVVVESGAGRDYNLDEAYEEAGATIASDAGEVYKQADVVLKIRVPSDEEIGQLGDGQVVIGFLEPLTEPERIEKLAEAGVTALALETVPRIARAQSMDALSSMGSIGGYKAALLAADSLGRYLPMMTTAAGTMKAGKVMVLGVGVAGLQAIATMKRLGAEVEAFDIRPEVADQVRSLGATWIEAKDEEEEQEGEDEEPPEPSTGQKLAGGLRALLGLPERSSDENGASASEEESDEEADGDEEDTGGYAKEQTEEKQRRDQELVSERIAEMDVVLTTALVPGKKAPTLVTEEMVASMKPGSLIVDLAAESGGNCELTEAGEIVDHEQVKIHGPTDVASTLPIHASALLSRNMVNLLTHLVKDKDKDEDEDDDSNDDEPELEFDFEDQITDETCVAHDGEVRGRTREALDQKSDKEAEAR
ncbi:MAG: NAD(P) transhydrogenase subunit alpha [Thermoleophilaceae bacterium]